MNKDIIDAFAKTAALLNQRGWSEGFGGNISAIYDINDMDIDTGNRQELGFKTENMPDSLMLITGTGTRMYLVQHDPMKYMSLILIEKNNAYLLNDVKPSSETESHIAAYAACNMKYRAAIHSHPPYLTAMTLLYDEKDLNEKLDSAHTEYSLVFPDGISMLGVLAPGSHELSAKTEEVIRAGRNTVLWKKHGMFSMGTDLFNAFDYMDAAEKCAKVSIITG